jgi:hypothetical protein
MYTYVSLIRLAVSLVHDSISDSSPQRVEARKLFSEHDLDRSDTAFWLLDFTCLLPQVILQTRLRRSVLIPSPSFLIHPPALTPSPPGSSRWNDVWKPEPTPLCFPRFCWPLEAASKIGGNGDDAFALWFPKMLPLGQAQRWRALRSQIRIPKSQILPLHWPQPNCQGTSPS